MKKLLVALVVVSTLGLAGCDDITSRFRSFYYAWFTDGEVVPGTFNNSLQVEFIDPPYISEYDTWIALLQPFSYTDSKGEEWSVPEAYLSNGATIPKGLWNLVGPPISSRYVRAAVIHDYFCEKQDRPWEEVHDMFFEAALASGTSLNDAKLLYAGVVAFGPRWEVIQAKTGYGRPPIVKAQVTPDGSSGTGESGASPTSPPSLENRSNIQMLQDLKKWIDEHEPSKEMIDQHVQNIRQEVVKRNR